MRHILPIDGRTDGHKYGHLDEHTDIRTDPNCNVIKKNILFLSKYPVIRPDNRCLAKKVSGLTLILLIQKLLKYMVDYYGYTLILRLE